MAVSEFNEDTQDQICDLLETLQQAEKLKNKDIRILLDKVVRKYGGKVVNKQLYLQLLCYGFSELNLKRHTLISYVWCIKFNNPSVVRIYEQGPNWDYFDLYLSINNS